MVAKLVRIKDHTARVARAAERASIRSLDKAGAYIRGIAIKSIKVSKKSAEPGKPPRSRKGRLKKAIIFAVDKERQNVIIGPSAHAIGGIGHTHEFGGVEPPKGTRLSRPPWRLEVGGHGPIRIGPKGAVVTTLLTADQVERARATVAMLPPAKQRLPQTKARHYPARRFMGPALDVSKARLPSFWANSVKGG